MTFEQDNEFKKRLGEACAWKPTYRRGFPYSLPGKTIFSVADVAFATTEICRIEPDYSVQNEMIDRFTKTFEPENEND